MSEWLEFQVRIKWPVPSSMTEQLVLLRALADNIPALINMIITVLFREKGMG